MSGLPVLRCRAYPFNAPSADPERSPWPEIERVALRKNESGFWPDQATDVRVAYDDLALRLLFVCVDSEPWSTLSGHDEPLYTEEVVEVFLDPVGDGDAYFELEVNVNNAVLDGCMRRVRSGYRKDFRWHCIGLRTAVRRCSPGWIAELAIPFVSVAGASPRRGERWRVNFTRIDRPASKPRELSAWSPTGIPQFHVPQKFGVLEFC
jgi:hypothetical protein